MPRARQLGLESDHRVEQPIDGQALSQRVDPQVTGQHEIRLARLHSDAGWESPTVEIPTIMENVMFGDDAPRRHRLGLRLDAGDPVDEHERFVRQAYPGRVSVHMSKPFAESPADRSDRELHELVPIHCERPGRDLCDGRPWCPAGQRGAIGGGSTINEGSARGNVGAVRNEGSDQLLLTGVLTLGEFLRPLGGSQERLVGVDRVLCGSNSFVQL